MYFCIFFAIAILLVCEFTKHKRISIHLGFRLDLEPLSILDYFLFAMNIYIFTLNIIYVSKNNFR